MLTWPHTLSLRHSLAGSLKNSPTDSLMYVLVQRVSLLVVSQSFSQCVEWLLVATYVLIFGSVTD